MTTAQSTVARFTGASVPIKVQLDLLSVCDLNCTHCYLSSRTSKGLSKERWLEIIDELAELGVLYLLVSGGEVFVRKDALEILRYARERRFLVKVISHGGRITEEVADELADMGILEVGVSLYSMVAEDHDAITRVPGSLERTVAGIRRLRERGVAVELKITVMPQNRDSWRTVLPFAHELGCDPRPSTAIFHRDDLDGEHFDAHNVGFDAKVQIHREMFEAASEFGFDIGFDSDACIGPEDAPCGAAHSFAYIESTGKVYPCNLFYWEVGNLETSTFAEVWHGSPRLHRLREISKSSFSECGGCSYLDGCAHCMAKQFHATGDPTRRAELVCADTHSRFAAAKLLGLYDGPTGPPGTGRAHLPPGVALDQVPDILSLAG